MKRKFYNLLITIQDWDIVLFSPLSETIRYSNYFKDFWFGRK